MTERGGLFFFVIVVGFHMNGAVRKATSRNSYTTEKLITFHTSCEFLRIFKGETNVAESVLDDQ